MIESLIADLTLGKAVLYGVVGLALLTIIADLRVTYRGRKLGALAPSAASYLPLGKSHH